MEWIQNVVNWVHDNWVGIIAVWLAIIKVVTTIRDILDKSPQTDDNWFEKICTLLGKLANSLIKGERPK